jgi:hypothetical protein
VSQLWSKLLVGLVLVVAASGCTASHHSNTPAPRTSQLVNPAFLKLKTGQPVNRTEMLSVIGLPDTRNFFFGQPNIELRNALGVGSQLAWIDARSIAGKPGNWLIDPNAMVGGAHFSSYTQQEYTKDVRQFGPYYNAVGRVTDPRTTDKSLVALPEKYYARSDFGPAPNEDLLVYATPSGYHGYFIKVPCGHTPLLGGAPVLPESLPIAITMIDICH